ncbi:ACP S-malonyltransferase [Ligilactobacillus equi]|uniref:ACP S-malonyltransferase n=1 Tax=Ligilactobacillus equi TaxID=137357 RepID=UPI002ED004AB
MKLGILFSGQGAQYSGMGLDFYAQDQLFAQKIDEASQITGLDLVKIFKNENAELDQTLNVQPALVAMSLGIYAMLKRDFPDLPVVGMTGLSLGEYSALHASGILSFADTMAVLKDRAQYMQADADAKESMMFALLGPDVTLVEQICAEISTPEEPVAIANYNSKKQVVIGGSPVAVTAASEQLQNAGAAKKVVPLKVSGAFHTPLFQNSSQKLAQRFEGVTFNEPNVTVMSNTTAQPLKAVEAAQVMAKQVCQPTHFADCAAGLITAGADTFLEIGPGQTLVKFAKVVDRKAQRFNIEKMEDYKAFCEAMRG